MAKYLMIVESPAKSKTIENYLGEDYIVESSKGHIRDLKTTGYGGYGVDLENHFQPQYKILKDKKDIVKKLSAACKKVDKVFLATDPDREGEAISWHLKEVLNLDEKPYARVVFQEITKKAVVNALENGRDIDLNLVRSQESRRILDRIIGFSLSKLLQKKIGSKSAGRVQSLALRLICEREREITGFVPSEYWEVFYEFTKDEVVLKAQLEKYQGKKIEPKSKQEVDSLREKIKEPFIVREIAFKTTTRNPKPPYITSTLQQDAFNNLNFYSKKTMRIAQQLYEGIQLENERVGLITYMRTDSIRMSAEFVLEAKKMLKEKYGATYVGEFGFFKPGKNAQDAHEAIRPTHLKYSPSVVKAYLANDEYKLYKMIYERSLASLMAPAKILEEKVILTSAGYDFGINGAKIVFPGFYKLADKDKTDKLKELPDFKEGEEIANGKIIPEQKFTNPPSRYSEARLIKKLEDVGVGRPSTYALVMDTLKIRNYVKIEKKLFVPTDRGLLTNDKLVEYFDKIINVEYTADMEKALDKISIGEHVWYDELGTFYQDFAPLLEYATEHMEKIYPVELDETCPECGGKLVIRNGRFGEFIACGNFPKCRYTKKKDPDAAPVSTGIKCPNCEKGMIVERISHRGRSAGKKFYACDQYPQCKTTFSSLSDIPKENP